MALPQKVVEQLGRTPVRTPGWSSRILMFSTTFFFLSALTWLGIDYGYQPFVNGQISRLDKQIADFSRQVPSDQQEEIINFFSQLINLKTIIGQQVTTSDLFSWLEANTNVNVAFTNFSYEALTHKVTLTGQARSLTNLAEQINRFRHQAGIQGLTLAGLTLDQKTGAWQFSLTLTLTPDFFTPASSPPPADNSSLVPTSQSSTRPLGSPVGETTSSRR